MPPGAPPDASAVSTFSLSTCWKKATFPARIHTKQNSTHKKRTLTHTRIFLTDILTTEFQSLNLHGFAIGKLTNSGPLKPATTRYLKMTPMPISCPKMSQNNLLRTSYGDTRPERYSWYTPDMHRGDSKLAQLCKQRGPVSHHVISYNVRAYNHVHVTPIQQNSKIPLRDNRQQYTAHAAK